MAVAARTGLRRFDGLVMLGVVATAAAFGLGTLGHARWEADLFSHFRVQYALALLLACAYLLVRRRWLFLLPSLLLLAYTGWPVEAYFLPRAAASTGHDKGQLRLMSLNVEASNDRADLVSTAIVQANPDVVFLPEATSAWADALAPLRARYPYGTAGGGDGPFSLLLLSRLPLRDLQVIRLAGDRPAVVARVC